MQEAKAQVVVKAEHRRKGVWQDGAEARCGHGRTLRRRGGQRRAWQTGGQGGAQAQAKARSPTATAKNGPLPLTSLHALGRPWRPGRRLPGDPRAREEGGLRPDPSPSTWRCGCCSLPRRKVERTLAPSAARAPLFTMPAPGSRPTAHPESANPKSNGRTQRTGLRAHTPSPRHMLDNDAHQTDSWPCLDSHLTHVLQLRSSGTANCARIGQAALPVHLSGMDMQRKARQARGAGSERKSTDGHGGGRTGSQSLAKAEAKLTLIHQIRGHMAALERRVQDSSHHIRGRPMR